MCEMNPLHLGLELNNKKLQWEQFKKMHLTVDRREECAKCAVSLSTLQR